jgi:SET domain-containing protein
MKEIYFIPITQLVFCNSSSTPNIETRYNPNYQTVYFKTIKPISKDEEILLDYRT